MVHHYGPHAYQHIVFDGAAMHDGAMAYRDEIANGGWCLLIGTVYDSSVLYVYFVADFDVVYIATHYGSEPHAAIIAHGYIAYHGCVLSQVAVVAKFWFYAFDGKNECHGIIYLRAKVQRFFLLDGFFIFSIRLKQFL